MNGPTPHEHDLDLEIAFDFLNTLELESGALVDRFERPADAFDWLSEHHVVHDELLDPERRRAAADPDAGERALGRVRRVRDALREVSHAIVERRRASSQALAEVNRALRARELIQLEPSDEGVLVGHRHVGDPIDDALARLAEPIVREISAGRPERLRVCDNETCRWVFYDSSPTGRRRWCDMATCGNQAKARRHRARQKASERGRSRGAARPN
ncbi:MAG TPA: CGNR zinc finger domain-containing protein [Candidatus Limnocylindrales bacterium]|jgi:predicted RNA-binding Zn ribbon-like protein|nr:CGNR zinc finger domain-containing protein [Candidatus Limnocylindrales bacterium]